MIVFRFFVRLRLLGKRNDDEDAKEKLYTYASYVHVTSFKVRLVQHLLRFVHSAYCSYLPQGLQTVVADAE